MMDFGKGDMFDYLESVMKKSDKFDAFVKSEIELQNVLAELKELGIDSDDPEETEETDIPKG